MDRGVTDVGLVVIYQFCFLVWPSMACRGGLLPLLNSASCCLSAVNSSSFACASSFLQCVQLSKRCGFSYLQLVRQHSPLTFSCLGCLFSGCANGRGPVIIGRGIGSRPTSFFQPSGVLLI